ncbi:hypothetical protein CI238_08539 [Colletotrichum incanum]|uniref:Uncharacterized protein n=1 Tax=Colletotrichum incanum TaxID=1573173 RepID=A0A167BTF8_COLIC|nr:hypothetical protein CI238_08539 [Colletotrichum incanum]
MRTMLGEQRGRSGTHQPFSLTPCSLLFESAFTSTLASPCIYSMFGTDQPSDSREEFVSELTSSYEFLTRIFLPSSAIRYPPESRWPHIDAEYIRSFCLNKNDTVVDLIEHIPFIQRDRKDDDEP